MCLERKDVRCKLSPDMHEALTVLADVDQVDIGVFVEAVLVRELVKRCHDATVIAQRTARLGISGNGREKPGMAGNLGECPGAPGHIKECSR